MEQNKKAKRYDTPEKKERFLRKKGNLLTFKKPFFPWGTNYESRIQILVARLNKERSGAVKIEGQFYDSNWYKNLNELLEAIDWEWMEDAHQFGL